MPRLSMKSVRNQSTAFRFDPTVKASLSFIAERDGRSMANMLEWLIRRHCEVEGLGWPPDGCEITVAKPQPVCPVTSKQGGRMQGKKGKNAD
ncbi:hypothetical protein DNK44_25905 [Pseudomonas dryadis]|uniref:Uncharacterized protein n=1 Tax=Phytopseudomonas dryadis TaxID=2487520 RepID=A0A4Q9QR44_9GAMM|nr:hypothetical protein DNK44_25905 [Pseudomonas dryadis]